MSYTNIDAQMELTTRMEEAVATRDTEEARTLSNLLFEIGDDEGAEEFRTMANQWDREDNNHDARYD